MEREEEKVRNQLERNKRNDLKNKRNANTYHLVLPARGLPKNKESEDRGEHGGRR